LFKFTAYKAKKLENFIANYDWNQKAPWEQTEQLAGMSPERQARVLELEKGNRGFLPDSVVYSTVEYAKDLAVWIVLSVVLLLSPILVRDRLHRMRQTQWGRQVLNVQFIAGVCSAFALTMVNVVLYAIPFVCQHPLALTECPLFNWSMRIYTWFDGTYGQYLGTLLLLLLALGLSVGAATTFLSQYSGNYVTMLLKAVPLFIVMGQLFGSWLMDRPFWFRPLCENVGIDLPEAVCAAALLVLGLVVLL